MNFTRIKTIFSSELRNKFALLFVLLASVPALVLGATALFLIDVSHRHDVSNLELQLIDEKINEIQKFFSNTIGILELRVGFTQTSEIALSEQKFLLAGLLEENRAFEEVSFLDLSGRETAKRFRGGIEVECGKQAEACDDVSGLPQFLVARGGETFIGEVYYTLSGPFITLVAPVRNRHDNIIQILSAEVNLASLVRSFENASLGAAGYLLLFDRDGALVASRYHDVVGIGADLSEYERVSRLRNGEMFNGLEDEDRYRSVFTNDAVVGSGKRIPDIGWLIAAEWPLRDSDAVINDIKQGVLRITLFGILAVLVLVPLFANRLLMPIQELRRGTEAVEAGDFEKHVEIHTHDELEDLGHAFNKMATGLKHLQELKNEFVFIAAHELRNPVTVINGYISLIFGDAAVRLLPETLADSLRQIKDANQRLLQLVADLLEVARSEAGRIVIEVAPLALEDSIAQIVSEMKPLADEKAISLDYDRPPNLARVLGNDARIKEIMVNLIGNAIKYSPREKPIVISHEAAGQEVITCVKDNGYGISAEAQKKLFEKFYRVQTKETEGIPGTGLGLFIIKQLVEKMNGKIWVQSEVGVGSSFRFSLPRASQ